MVKKGRTAEKGPVMKSNQLLKRWKSQLSAHLGRNEESIVNDGLLATDFPGSSVHIVFEDGSDLVFARSFYLNERATRTTKTSIKRVAVFTEHVGYHEFWVGPDDSIEIVDADRTDRTRFDGSRP